MNDNFKKFLEKFYSVEQVKNLLEAIETNPISCFRVNTKKNPSLDLLSYTKHPFVDNAFYFDKKADQLGKTFNHETGAIYIQDASAMMVVSILNLRENDLVLDLCAAPGGKSTQAALLTNNLVYCNDLSFSRTLDLVENIERLGLNNLVVLNNNPVTISKGLEGQFDKVILDAPCSGEGMFRKNEAVMDDWSMEKVNKLVDIQKELILIAYKSLKFGGEMTYSTCTYNKLENEEVVQYLLDNTNAEIIPIAKYEGIDESSTLKGTVHIFPNNFKGEGHFIAHIKSNDTYNYVNNYVKPKIDNKSFNLFKEFEKNNLSSNIVKDELLQVGSKLYYVPIKTLLIKNANYIKYQLYLGEVENSYFTPSHHLGSNTDIKWKNIINFSSASQDAISYIKGLSIKINNYPNGYYQVQVDNIPLGVCKIANNTLKNYYPKKLRK